MYEHSQFGGRAQYPGFDIVDQVSTVDYINIIILSV